MSCHVMSCQYCTIQCTTTPYNATRHNNISLNEIKSHAPMHVTCVQMAGCMQRMVIWPTQKLWDAVDASLSSAYSIISHRIISHRLHCILSTIKIYDSIIVAHSIVFWSDQSCEGSFTAPFSVPSSFWSLSDFVWLISYTPVPAAVNVASLIVAGS